MAYVYDTYGEARMYKWPTGDFDRDGDAESAADSAGDNTAKGYDDDDADYLTSHTDYDTGSATDTPWLDLTGDGKLDSADLAVMTVTSAPIELAYSAVNNPYLFTGRLTDTLHADSPTDVAHIRRLQDNRNRIYLPKYGRCTVRDPLGIGEPYSNTSPFVNPVNQYDGSPNLFEYVQSRPTNGRDPLGLRDWVDKTADFTAGVGDSLSMGLTQQARKGLNWLVNDGYSDSWTHTHSGYYIAGEIIETAVEITVTAGGATLKKTAKTTSRQVIEGNARRTFRRKHELSGGFVHHINPIKGHPGGEMTRYPLPFEWAARGEWNMKWVPDKATHLGEHQWMMQLEALDKVRASTMLVRQAGNAVVQHALSNGACDPSVNVSASTYGEVNIYAPGSRSYKNPFSPPSGIGAYERWVEQGNIYLVP